MTSDPRGQKPKSDLQAWAGVIALAMAAFIFNTTEFVPIGLLSDIGQSFDMSAAQTGIMLTVYAWVVALASLPLMLLTRNIERRKLLLGLFGLFVVSHVLAGFAESFGVLLISRIGIALAHAVFWSITAALAVRIAPEGKKAQALGWLASGTSIALVLGLPLGRIVGDWVGWRMTFLAIAVIATIVAIILWRLLPLLPSKNAGSFASVPMLFKRPALVCLYVLTAVMVAGHFTANSYVEPFVKNIAHVPSEWVTGFLLLLGGSGLIGSFLFGHYNGRYPRLMLLGSLAVLSLSLFCLLPAAQHHVLLASLCVFWGAAMMVFALSMQSRVLTLAADATDVAMALFSGIFNIGIGAGALIGSQVSQHLGMQNIGFVGGSIGLAALLWCAFALWKFAADFKAGSAQVSH